MFISIIVITSHTHTHLFSERIAVRHCTPGEIAPQVGSMMLDTERLSDALCSLHLFAEAGRKC